MEKKKKCFLIIVLLFLLVVLLLRSCDKNSDTIKELLPFDELAQEWVGKQDLPNGAENGGRIQVPGFSTLVFNADQKSQKVNFYNPEENNCLFLMTLYVDEGREVWKSGYVQPGRGYYDIELNETLEKGEYNNAYLLINCFREDGTALNSARVEFNLTVK